MGKNNEIMDEIMNFFISNRECLKKLKDWMNVYDLRNDDHDTLLHVAAKMGDRELLELVYDKERQMPRDKLGRTPLHYAASREVAEFLLQNNAHVNDLDNDGKTPLHYAVLNGRTDVVEVLLENGADVNAKDAFSNTPLKLAFANGRIRIAKMLIERAEVDGNVLFDAVWYGDAELVGAILRRVDPNVRDAYGRTPLHIAALRGFVEIVRLLLQHGADPNARDENGRSIMHYVEERCKLGLSCKELMELLNKHADMGAKKA
jgi:ankyrin repeat protein